MNDYRILVVDDEEDLCEILKFNLENEGYFVDTANSAEEALKICLLYTSDAADEEDSVDLGGRRITQKKKNTNNKKKKSKTATARKKACRQSCTVVEQLHNTQIL